MWVKYIRYFLRLSVSKVRYLSYLGRLLLGDVRHVGDQLQVPLDIPAVDVGLRTKG